MLQREDSVVQRRPTVILLNGYEQATIEQVARIAASAVLSKCLNQPLFGQEKMSLVVESNLSFGDSSNHPCEKPAHIVTHR